VDTDLADITVDDGAGHVGLIHTTQHHPFWDETAHGWVLAGDLVAGASTLLGADGHRKTVLAVRDFTGQQEMRNLTVDGLHTFYVVVGDTPVLVHNTGPIPLPPGVIYLRVDVTTTPGVTPLDDYVGQAKSQQRFRVRQQEHARLYPGRTFQYHQLDNALPGQDLDVKEESWMRAGGGPNTASNPNTGPRLSNERVQMIDQRYLAAGGDVCQ
jgi:hypothetical protein